MKRATCILFIVALLAAPAVWAEDKKKESTGFKFRHDPKIGAVTAKKPVHIKLRRLKGGEYTWDLTGDDVEELYRVDRELRRKFGKKKKR